MITGRLPPATPGVGSGDNLTVGYFQPVAMQGAPAFTAVAPGDLRSSTLSLNSNRQLTPTLGVSSHLEVDAPFCGDHGPRDGALFSEEFFALRRGLLLHALRCSPYSTIRCHQRTTAIARRRGRSVAAIKTSEIVLDPGASQPKTVIRLAALVATPAAPRHTAADRSVHPDVSDPSDSETALAAAAYASDRPTAC